MKTTTQARIPLSMRRSKSPSSSMTMMTEETRKKFIDVKREIKEHKSIFCQEW